MIVKQILSAASTVKRIFSRVAIPVAIATIAPALASQSSTPDGAKTTVQAQMHNVEYHFSKTVAVHILNLNGELVPLGKNEFPIFDDKESFLLSVRSGEISITAVDLGTVLNTYVFSRPGSPIGDMGVSIEKGKLKTTGKLRDKGNIPFEILGSLSPTQDGKVRIHPESIKALHLPVKGLLDLLRIKTDDLIKSGNIPGVTTDGSDLILDLEKVLPPPHIRGKVTAIRIEGDSLIQTYGSAGDKGARISQSGNYMAYRGNSLRFGKLTMSDTDLTLIDMDPTDPFDFYLDHYKEQLAGGYTKIAPSFGLKVYVKDFDKLSAVKAASGSKAATAKVAPGSKAN